MSEQYEKERIEELDTRWNVLQDNINWLESQLQEQARELVSVDEEYDYLVSVHPELEPQRS